jgi:hypothetical protein
MGADSLPNSQAKDIEYKLKTFSQESDATIVIELI